MSSYPPTRAWLGAPWAGGHAARGGAAGWLRTQASCPSTGRRGKMAFFSMDDGRGTRRPSDLVCLTSRTGAGRGGAVTGHTPWGLVGTEARSAPQRSPCSSGFLRRLPVSVTLPTFILFPLKQDGFRAAKSEVGQTYGETLTISMGPMLPKANGSLGRGFFPPGICSL